MPRWAVGSRGRHPSAQDPTTPLESRAMGDLQHFCLRWNNYQSSITSAFENLRDDEDFVDVTLACDGKSLKAHRVVLSACSPYFRELLKSTPCKHPVIVLQDVIFEDLHALVEFIYHGEVNVHQKALPSFLKTAEVLRVSGLTQQSEVREEATEKAGFRDSTNAGEDNWLAYRRTPTTPSHRHRERRPSASDNTDNQESNVKKIKTETNSELQAPQPSSNHQEKEESEPPMDFSTSNPAKAARKNDSSEASPGRERDREREKEGREEREGHSHAPVKSEPAEGGGGGGGEADDSNESAVMSEPQIVTTEPDDSAHSGHQQNYFDSKLFAVAGASFNFSMAAALAADSLAGLNNQGHNVGGGTDGLAGTSQGWRGRPTNKLLCDICNKSYRTMNSLRNHRSIYHRKFRVEGQFAEPQFGQDDRHPFH
ncbi:broad-complex core protein isoforms 1/2/3/4/5-like isoform X4 [Homalodisca vitripennis]|uniref:broad-complex core protein isoforms 1/2/3/4/5-like isoform X4 n=1 Tax=Homalodisca vitripennis TaxID=197043 RepID=UPI001EEA1F6F|nr:broad-complex core protein isoforms 1/2/3/4/5-like isoform X4 [Homalodisca vitripennis]